LAATINILLNQMPAPVRDTLLAEFVNRLYEKQQPTIDTQAGNSERWKLVLTLGVTFLIAYYDRLNISLAMPLIAAENGWSDAETASNGALLMGLFYGGFGLANIFLTPLGTQKPGRDCPTVVSVHGARRVGQPGTGDIHG
jgi:hypothetical protein